MSSYAKTTEWMIWLAEIFRFSTEEKEMQLRITSVSQEDFTGLAWRWEQGLLQRLSVLL